MTEQERWKAVQELNKTPLSQECRKLLKKPEVSSLYLLQALSAALEMFQPQGDRRMWKASFNTAESARYLVEELLPSKNPRLAYKVLTTSAELPEEMSDSAILELLKQETKAEDKLWALLDTVECNLEDSGFNLSRMDTENPGE